MTARSPAVQTGLGDRVESLTMLAELRDESEQGAREVRRVVEEGKRKYNETVARFAIKNALKEAS